MFKNLFLIYLGFAEVEKPISCRVLFFIILFTAAIIIVSFFLMDIIWNDNAILACSFRVFIEIRLRISFKSSVTVSHESVLPNHCRLRRVTINVFVFVLFHLNKVCLRVEDHHLIFNSSKYNDFLRIQNTCNHLSAINGESYFDRLPSLGSLIDGTSRFSKLFDLVTNFIIGIEYVDRVADRAAWMFLPGFVQTR